MDILIYTILVFAVLLFFIWTWRVNRKEKRKLSNRLNRDFPHRETHKESGDPDDLKQD
jgi:hypothetical protein